MKLIEVYWKQTGATELNPYYNEKSYVINEYSWTILNTLELYGPIAMKFPHINLFNMLFRDFY